MNPCTYFQSELLEYLYGALEPAEQQAVADHLKGCQDCQAALTGAEGHRRLLAAAAKSEFPDVEFGAPIVLPPSRPFEAPIPPAAQRGWAWGRWAVAAAVLLAVAGLGLVNNTYWRQHDLVVAARERAEADREQIARLQKDHAGRQHQSQNELRDAQQALARLNVQDVHRKASQLAGEVAGRPLHLVMSGPPTPEAGALNEYNIEVRNQNNQLTPAEFSARLLDRSQSEITSNLDVRAGPQPGFYKLSLPRNLPLRPDSDLYLVLNARGVAGNQGELTEKLKLVAPSYLTHLATDKPMYQPGEAVRFRSLTLERFSLKPVREELHPIFEITRPAGEKEVVASGAARLADEVTGTVLLGPDREPLRGVGAGIYPVPPDAPGGEYTLTVREAAGRFPAQERKFIVNEYQKSELNKELDFTRKSFGPGEDVGAVVKVTTAQGNEPVRGAAVRATLKVDGVFKGGQSLRTDAAGTAHIKLRLPQQIERGDANLSVEFNDGAHVETLTRPVPVVLKKLQVEFFPEGGDLVAGVPNRVYFQARTTLDKPAELTGRLVAEDGAAVAEVRTLNDPKLPGVNHGMGAFTFTPDAGKKYELRIDTPTGIEGKYPLQADVKTDGVVLAVPSGVTSDQDPIHVVLRNVGANRRLLVGAYCRGRLMAHQRVEAPAGTTELDLRPNDAAGGVYRITVFEETGMAGDRVQLLPRAERLVFRAPAHRLNVTVETDKPRYEPGEQVTLRYRATDERGEPAPAVLMVAVVDKRVLTLADEKTFRTMPTHFLLTTEVRRPEDLEYADFLLGPEPKARQALDLLLGTQGWRRFAEQTNPSEFRKKNPDDGTRLMVVSGRLSPATLAERRTDVDLQPIEQAYEDFRAQFGGLEDRLAKAENRVEEVRREGEQLNARLGLLAEDGEAARRRYEEGAESLSRTQSLIGRTLLPGLAVLLFAGAALSLVVGLLRRSGPQTVPCLVTAGCALALFGLVLGYQLQRDGFQPRTISQLAPLAEEARVAVGPRPQYADARHGPHADAEDEQAGFNLGGPGREGQGKAGDQKAEAKRMPAAPEAGFQKEAGGAPRFAAPAAARKLNEPQADRQKEMDKAIRPGAPVANFHLAPKKDAEALKAPQAGLGDARLREVAPRDRDGKALDGAKKQAVRDLEQVNARRMAPPARPPLAPGGAMATGALRAERAAFGRGPLQNQIATRQAQLAREAVPAPPLFVRQYAHRHVGGESEARSDATETVFWHPVLVLPDGRGQSTFDLSDSVTTFQILATGHTADGRLAAVKAQIDVRKSLTLEPKLPIEVTAGDKIDVPLAVANGTDNKLAVDVRLQPTNLKVVGKPEAGRLALAPNGTNRRVYRVEPATVEGEARLHFDGRSGAYTDRVVRSFRVAPEGFPVVGTQSDLLEKSARHDLVLPDSWLPGTLKYQVAVYPSTLADLQKGLEALLREPNGCFEQTSTTNYPNLLILNYLRDSDQAKPEVAGRALDLLGRGYQKLTSFECLNPAKNQREGYEWFGGTAPAHEALTAYGLMQFRDMAHIYPVDRAMLKRTRGYLMSRRDGQGGFKRNPRALDTFGRAPDHITNAYIVWALTESGKEDDVTRELNAVAEQAKTSTDPYFLALVANSLLNRGRPGEAVDLLKKLAEAQKPDGHLDAAQTSITGSGGRDLQIETTALSVLAWIKAKRPDVFNVAAQKAVRWIGRQRGGYGGFGSTQSTILTLKALIAYARANKKTAEAGELTLFVGGEPVLRKPFAAGVEEALVLELSDAEKRLKPGHNDVRVEITGKSVFPYTATWSYQSLKPASAEGCAVGLATQLERATAHEGETVGLTVRLENKSGRGQGMTVAIVGLPAGLTLPEDMKKLKDLARLRNNGTERGVIDAWEVRGRELVLYWRDLAPDKKIEVNLELICRVPGEYRGPASRAYLYYNADHKCWAEPLKVAIQARSE